MPVLKSLPWLSVRHSLPEIAPSVAGVLSFCVIGRGEGRRFWVSTVHADTQTNISGLLVLGTVTPMPELPSVEHLSLISLLVLPRLGLRSVHL